MGIQQMFLGISGITINVTDANLSSVDPTTGGAAQCSCQISSNGTYTYTGGLNSNGSWLSGDVASNYEIMATVSSSNGLATRIGTTGSWLALSTSRTWTLNKSGTDGQADWVLSIQVRRASDSVVVDTATFNMSVSVGVV